MTGNLAQQRAMGLLHNAGAGDVFRLVADGVYVVGGTMTEPTGTARAAILDAELARVVKERDELRADNAAQLRAIETAWTIYDDLDIDNDQLDTAMQALFNVWLPGAPRPGTPWPGEVLLADLARLRAERDAAVARVERADAIAYTLMQYAPPDLMVGALRARAEAMQRVVEAAKARNAVDMLTYRSMDANSARILAPVLAELEAALRALETGDA